jgi:hypothetical protein
MNSTALTIIGKDFFTELQIQKQCDDALNNALEADAPINLYLKLKQLEYAVKYMLEHVHRFAAISFLEISKGDMKGEIAGHKVAIFNKASWSYTCEIEKLKERQKAELKSRQLSEQASGEAILIANESQEIKITLRKG